MVIRFIFLVAIFFALFFFFEIYISTEEGDEVLFKIERGERVFDIADNLKKEGLIRTPYIFSTYILFSGKKGQLKAGTYLFSPNMSLSQMAQKIHKGEVYQKRITIIEGWNLNDIASYIEEDGIGTKEEFYQFTGRPPYVENGQIFEGYNGKMAENNTLEGYLFPDTYYLDFNAEVEDLIKAMIRNFENKSNEEWSKEIIIIASLIEKEVRLMEDKKIVSGIIRKRINLGMPLQIDATITYITGKRTTNVSIEETQIDSLYNTYLYRGLPKGPISNPGLSSIEAAINPQESNYLYYLSKPTGETVFSRTLEEHNVAKNKYLR